MNLIPIAWLVIAIIFFIIEGATVQLITIWFAISALLISLVSIFLDSFIIQIVLFLFISIVLLLSTRPILKKYLERNKIRTNVYSLIGEYGIVISESSNSNLAEVKIKSQIWSAVEKNGKNLKKDEQVKVVSIEGVKLVVENKQEEK